MDRKMTFALCFCNRGFMPGELIYGAREDMIQAVTKAGYDYLAMDAELTRFGGVETREEGRLYAKWLKDHELTYKSRNIKEENPTEEELTEWIKRSGLPVKRFFNTSGMLYREMGLKDKLPEMSEAEQIALLATDGMLVKRPLLVTEKDVKVAFKEAEWSSLL